MLNINEIGCFSKEELDDLISKISPKLGFMFLVTQVGEDERVLQVLPENDPELLKFARGRHA